MTSLILEHIDKSNWKAFPFEKIAKRVAETVDPNKTDLDIYYGLEHLDSDDIHIRRNGTPDDVSGGKLKCYPGDVIFGKRRAYQRKAGIVTQAAICSAHSFVFRANEEIMDARLFPFFLHSDQFMHRMVDISVGGLSPTINWSDLKHQEFLLPSKAQQAELAELLWAVDEVIEKDLVVLRKFEQVLKSLLTKTFVNKTIIDSKHKVSKTIKSLYQTENLEQKVPHDWKIGNVNEFVSQANSGFAEGLRDSNGKPQLRMNNVTRDGRIDLREVATIPIKPNKSKYIINLNDVLFCNTNSDDLVGKTILANSSIDGFYFSNHFTRLVCSKELRNEYLYLNLKFLFDIGLFQRICVKWIGQAAVQLDSLLNIQILVPPLEEQNVMVEKYFRYLNNLELLESKIEKSKALQKALINQLF